MAESANRPHSHMQDFEAHIRAVEEDLEYYRTKRFEPRVLYLHRRGVLTLTTCSKRPPRRRPSPPPRPHMRAITSTTRSRVASAPSKTGSMPM